MKFDPVAGSRPTHLQPNEAELREQGATTHVPSVLCRPAALRTPRAAQTMASWKAALSVQLCHTPVTRQEATNMWMAADGTAKWKHQLLSRSCGVWLSCRRPRRDGAAVAIWWKHRRGGWDASAAPGRLRARGSDSRGSWLPTSAQESCEWVVQCGRPDCHLHATARS